MVLCLVSAKLQIPLYLMHANIHGQVGLVFQSSATHHASKESSNTQTVYCSQKSPSQKTTNKKEVCRSSANPEEARKKEDSRKKNCQEDSRKKNRQEEDFH